MTKFKYTEFEAHMNSVLKHQQEMLSEVNYSTLKDAEVSITETKALLKSLGYKTDVLDTQINDGHRKNLMVVPSWEELCKEAEQHVGNSCTLESLCTEDELKSNELAIRQLNEEFNSIHRLDSFDITISALAGIVGALVDILLVGIPDKTPTGIKAGTLSNYIRDYFDHKFPQEEMEKLANSKVSKVPFDAQDNRHTTVYVEGLSAYYHRLLQLGHDPLLGFIFGIADILNGTMTTIDKKGSIVTQIMENYADRKETDVFLALAKQIIHLQTDITTTMGLPVPLMSLFNLLQFGSIGEAEQTIAEIVQGMYYAGYDFIHFCSMSVSAMIVEVMVRIGYAIRRVKDGCTIQESIPISINREKHPKLASMLFIAHTASAAANAGKVCFKKNPLAINYPQWIVFAKYSYSQLKWALIKKPALRNIYVQHRNDKEFNLLLTEVNATFDKFADEYTVVFN